ncbi:MAG: HEAT repeat domain-containing protein [Candidatus Eremiobacteraeota bacterium]|nr:HEAT repeat domain-containing protein [Candidatus Eremiobacteraeota bacterium]
MAKKIGLFDSLFKKIGMKIYDFDAPEECMRALDDKEPEMRIKALETIGTRHSEAITDISKIVRIMKTDENFQVQETAMTTLGDLKRQEAVGPIIDMLQSQDQWMRVKAAMILGQIGDTSALEAIKKAYQSVKGEYQATIMRVITKLEAKQQEEKGGGAPPKPEPVPVPEAPPFKQAPLQAETALLRKAEPKAAPEPQAPFEAILQERQAVRSLGQEQRTSYATAPLEKESYREKRSKDDKLLENLRFQLTRASGSQADEQVVDYYYKALSKGDMESEQSLCALLWAPTENMRLQALQALTGIERRPHIVRALLEALDECSLQMCWRLIVALCSVEDVKIGERLVEFLMDSDEKIRRYAQNYFLLYGSADMIEVLMKEFDKCDERVKIERASLIARMDIDDIKPALHYILQDKSQPERVVLSLLDKLPPRHEDVIAYSLPELLARKEESIIDALQRKIRTKSNLLLLEYLRQNLASPSEVMRGRAATLLGYLDDASSAPVIAKLLQDKADFVRVRAARALLSLKALDYHKVLFMLARKDPNLRNRLEFVQIIDQMYQEKALPVFLELISDESIEMRCLVLECLGKKEWGASEKERLIEIAQPLLLEGDLRVVFYGIALLARLGSRKFAVDKQRILTVLWTIVKEPRNPPKIRKEALFALFYVSKEDTKEVLKSIVKKDPDDDLRIQAVNYLGSYTGKDVEDALSQACRAQNRSLAKAAGESLEKIRTAAP